MRVLFGCHDYLMPSEMERCVLCFSLERLFVVVVSIGCEMEASGSKYCGLCAVESDDILFYFCTVVINPFGTELPETRRLH